MSNIDLYKGDYLKAVDIGNFNKKNEPIECFEYELQCPHKRQYILRRMIKNIHKEFVIDKDIEWCKPIIEKCVNKQEELGIRQPFCYITIRHGIVDSATDDEWHTDGFSQVITHLPEQNYIATSNDCTEYIISPIKIPNDFDGLRHNIHWYIQEQIELIKPTIQTAKENTFYLFSPYCIHRRPPSNNKKHRTFVRVTFTPIEICDDMCDKADGKYARTANDTRSKLRRYSSRER